MNVNSAFGFVYGKMVAKLYLFIKKLFYETPKLLQDVYLRFAPHKLRILHLNVEDFACVVGCKVSILMMFSSVFG